MKNLWSDKEAQELIARYAQNGVPEDVATCVHGTRLLGRERTLVLHGGGNTSVKTTMTDLAGDAVEVLRVKGSGWDMAAIEPRGLPAVRLEPLRRLLGRDGLDDGEMVNLQRLYLLDSRAPTPSVEFLLHAFLPARFIDHTHSDAVLALTNQADWHGLCSEVFGARLALVPYVMSGFGLARAARAAIDANPDVEGLILVKHGIFTFGDSARQAYDRMIELVTLAEQRIARAGRKGFEPAALPKAPAPVAEVAPILRGLTALTLNQEEELRKPFVLDFRCDPEVLEFVNGAAVADYSQRGTATPDYVIRTKATPLIVPAPEADGLDAFRAGANAAIQGFRERYLAYFERHNARHGGTRMAADPMPRVILVPGLGLFGLGATARDAAIAADLALTNIAVITAAEAVGRFEAIPEADVFDIEYWSPEQAKLDRPKARPLEGQVALVTGGASGIGLATAQAFRAQGAEVVVVDLDQHGAKKAALSVDGLGLGCDVTDRDAIRGAFDDACATFGGVDIVVSNAGAAWQGRIGDVDEAVLRKSFELNFWSHQTICQNAVRVMRAQGLGGCLLFNTSKQAVNPGPDFGPYGLPKAALLFLSRQYAIDHGRDGIRSNAVNADRIRSGLLTTEMVASRSKARGLSVKEYMAGNLLGLEVTADDVAQCFVHLALDRKTTAAVLTVDGGNIAAALR